MVKLQKKPPPIAYSLPPLELPPKPRNGNTLPHGMRIKRVSNVLLKKINFDNAMCPSKTYNLEECDPYADFPYGSFDAFISRVRCYPYYVPSRKSDANQPLLYPMFQTRQIEGGIELEDIGCCCIDYALTDVSGNHFEHAVDIFVRAPLSNGTQEFLSHLTQNGISSWDQLVGCQVRVTVQIRNVPYSRGTIRCVVVEEHEFIYEPAGGGNNAKSR